MGFGRTTISSLTVGAIALTLIVLAGCGGDSRAEDTTRTVTTPTVSPAYTKLVTGLRDAAHASASYHAARRALALRKAERAVVRAFCTFSWQLPINHLVDLVREHAYVVQRITHLAELEYHGGAVGYDVEDAPIQASMARLRRIVDLRSLDGHLLRRYSKACYR